jgi:DUF1009 family protein
VSEVSCAEERERVALLCGAGPFPVLLARAAAARGVKVLALGWEGKVDEQLEVSVQRLNLYPFGLLEGMLEFLAKEKIKKAMLAGKFDKSWLYQGHLQTDEVGQKILRKLRDHQDDTMLDLVAEELLERGIEVADNTEYIRDWLAPVGVLTDQHPTGAQEEDIKFGMNMAREIGRLGIGQSVVVKHGNVVAVEAMEHTDECIRRASRLAGAGTVVVKAARPGQDLRYDVPVVGMETLECLDQAGAAVLAVEAERTVLIERERLLESANRQGLCIVGVRTG